MRSDSTVQEGDQKSCGGRGIMETIHPSGKNPRGESLKEKERKEQEKKKQESKKLQV